MAFNFDPLQFARFAQDYAKMAHNLGVAQAQAAQATQDAQYARAAQAAKPGSLDKFVDALGKATKVANATIPLAGDLTTLGLKVSWKATKLFGQLMTLGIMAWGVGQLGTHSIFAAEAATKASNLGVKVLFVAGSGFLAYQGARYVKDNIEDAATTAARKAKLYLAPKPPKQKAFKPRPKFPDLHSPPAKPPARQQDFQGIDPRELAMLQQLFGGAGDH
ncbi:MAG TPA: hypothetical protein VGO47_13685 [Chlamydiales bacterium]|jgi:hypothetical protein|nr:hypothetical protein [Chlamydiales bacterium]